ncbi:MAG TPA: hypothetical protein VGS60_09260 [Actinomycetes bacterium]|jgi:PASTA domain|nr:hypothetical protein [Actinomycetes bacterium]
MHRTTKQVSSADHEHVAQEKGKTARRRIAAAAGTAIVMSVLFLSGCGTSQPDNAAAPVATVTVTSQPTSQPGSTPSVESSETPSAASSEEAVKMPRLVGMVLQDAQDTLQSLGSYVLDQQDATGLDRWQMLDSNWKVCSQDPAPGARVPLSATVSLASVKLSESCP